MKLPHFLSDIDWKKLGRVSLFLFKTFSIILARLVYLLTYELGQAIKKVSVFMYSQTFRLHSEIQRRRVKEKTKHALHIGAVTTWIFSKKLTKQVIKQSKKFVVFSKPYMQKFTALVIKYSKRSYKRSAVVATYFLIRIQKTNTYKKVKTTAREQVINPILRTATSRKPYALALMVIIFITSSLVFLNDQRAIQAATNTWTQANWDGGVGTSTSDEYASQSGLDVSTNGQVAITQASNWYDPNWGYRKAITIDNTKVSGSSDLINFPILISETSENWKSTSNGGNVVQTDGGDIVFTNSAGTKLDHEIESYTATTGNIIAWVEVDTVDYDDDTTLYMYYGNDAGSLDESNAAGVWSGYDGVWHLGDGDSIATDFYQDSTTNSNHGTLTDSNGDSSQVSGAVGNALDFDDEDYMTLGPVDSFSDGQAFTASFWTNPGSGANPQDGFITQRLDINNRITIKRNLANNGFMVQFNNGGNSYVETGAVFTAGVNAHVVVVYDGTEATAADRIKMYVDGSATAIVNSAGTPPSTAPDLSATSLIFGDDTHGGGREYDGVMDEIRITGAVISYDWIGTEYANQNAPTTFISLSAEEHQHQTTVESGWYDTSWIYRNSITIDNTKVSGSSDLINFPVLISETSANWKSTSNGGNVAQTDGGDIVFTNSAGTKLDHEIESYTATTGNIIAWVKVDTVDYDDDTTLYMYYGNDAGSLDESNVAGVWSTADYAAVWHFGEGDSTATDFYKDSTANNNDGTLTDADGDTIATTGKIGGAVDFTGDGDQITVPDADSLSFGDGSTDSPFSISAWIQMDSENNWQTLKKAGGSTSEYAFNDVSTLLAGYILDTSAGAYAGRKYSVNMSSNNNSWIHTVMTYDGSGTEAGIDLYVNGAVRDNVSYSSGSYTAMENGDSDLVIGGSSWISSNGEIDNIVMAKSGLTADWIATEYANQNDSSTFYSVGSLSSTTHTINSASFDTGEASSLFSSIAWTETLITNTDLKIQIRTSADGSAWTDWLGPTSTSDYYTDNTGGETLNSTHTDGSNDQYIQYLAYFSTSDARVTPTLSDVSIQYTGNGPPNFNDDYPTSSAGGSQVSAVSTDGTSAVTINYSVRDTDSTTGTATPGYITPSFEYSLNGGSTWASATSGYLGGSDLSNKAVDESTYNIYEATWNAEGQLGSSIYVTNAQIRTTADDNEGGNNTASSTSAGFTLDTTSPAASSTPMTVDASVSPAIIGLNCTDDTALTMQIGLASDLTDASYVSYTATSTLASVGTPSDLIYGRCKDAYGNTNSIQSVTTPTQPTNMFYQDISNTSESDYSLFVSWSTVPAPSAGFTNYKLYRSTDGSNYSLYETINSRTTNFYIDTGLSTGTTYYYKLVVTDDDGNVSAYSSVVSDNPDGFGGTDTTSPSISAVSATSTPMESTVSWTTNELSNSTVYYSATTTDLGATPGNYVSSQGVGSFVTAHSVSLSNLTPGTQYYYLVRSADNLSNIGTDSSSGTFTTGAGVSISAVSASIVYNEEATITWNTDSDADSTVYYSTNADLSSSSSLNSASTSSAHSLNITGLTGGTNYYYYVESTAGGNTTFDKNVVDGVTEYYRFTTTSDSAAPVISNVNNALIGELGVTIAWTTDEGGTSQVAWGLTASLGSTTTETAVYTTQHAVTLTGLEDTTNYYYRVIAEDRANNVSIDDNSGSMYSVTTNPPGGGGGGVSIFGGDTQAPSVESLASSPNENSAIITFTTDEPAGVMLQYGSGSFDDNEINKTNIFQTSHVFTLNDLLVNTSYYYKITILDTSSNEITKSGSFSTLSLEAVTPDIGATVEEDTELDLGEIGAGVEEDNVDSETNESDKSIADLARNASEGTVREVLESIFDNSNLFNIPSDFLLASASKLAANFNHSVISNEELENIDKEFLFENLRVAGVTGQSATLVWRTTVPTKTVLYLTDLRTGETRELEDGSFLLSHEYTVGKLVPTASYSVQVVAENEFGERIGSQSLSFSTFIDKKPPIITEVKTNTSILAGKENKVQAIITWKTNKPTTSRVLYEAGVGEGDDFSLSSVLNQSYSYDHVVVVSGLLPGQIYRLRAESVDGQTNTVYSNDRTLMTPRSRESIVDVIIENFEQTFRFLR